jgi:8-oxo-dGTP diphosphatase
MKTLEVVAAIIKRDNMILAVQRGYGEFVGAWEFPGGKIERDETDKQALIREIQEELAVSIKIQSFFMTIEYAYESFHLVMHCYICQISNGEINLIEHSNMRWLDADRLDEVSWLPADIAVVEAIKSRDII